VTAPGPGGYEARLYRPDGPPLVCTLVQVDEAHWDAYLPAGTVVREWDDAWVIPPPPMGVLVSFRQVPPPV
jgi:hypothetical protein